MCSFNVLFQVTIASISSCITPQSMCIPHVLFQCDFSCPLSSNNCTRSMYIPCASFMCAFNVPFQVTTAVHSLQVSLCIFCWLLGLHMYHFLLAFNLLLLKYQMCAFQQVALHNLCTVYIVHSCKHQLFQLFKYLQFYVLGCLSIAWFCIKKHLPPV